VRNVPGPPVTNCTRSPSIGSLQGPRPAPSNYERSLRGRIVCCSFCCAITGSILIWLPLDPQPPPVPSPVPWFPSGQARNGKVDDVRRIVDFGRVRR
jgi:hypothetical protein